MSLSDRLDRRKVLYELLHPETKRGTAGAKGTNRKLGRGQKDATEDISVASPVPSFTEDTAAKLGVSPRSVEQSIQIARSLTPETKAVVRETPLKNKRTEQLRGIAGDATGEVVGGVASLRNVDGVNFSFALGSPHVAQRILSGSLDQLLPARHRHVEGPVWG